MAYAPTQSTFPLPHPQPPPHCTQHRALQMEYMQRLWWSISNSQIRFEGSPSLLHVTTVSFCRSSNHHIWCHSGHWSTSWFFTLTYLASATVANLPCVYLYLWEYELGAYGGGRVHVVREEEVTRAKVHHITQEPSTPTANASPNEQWPYLMQVTSVYWNQM